MSVKTWIQDHIELYRKDPEKAHYWDASAGGGTGLVKALLLTTKGRTSGKPIPTPLIYDKSGESFVVIASKGGAPEHPHWYLNLLNTPVAEIQVASTHHRVKARVAAGAERAKLWAQLAKIYPPYDEYQKKTGGREIPVVVLDPVTA